jgi:hypothetical protein
MGVSKKSKAKVKVFEMWKKAWSAQSLSGENKGGVYYTLTLRDLATHETPEIFDDFNKPSIVQEEILRGVKVISIGPDYYEVFMIKKGTDLLFIINDPKFHSQLNTEWVMHLNKTYFLGPKIPEGSVKTTW